MADGSKALFTAGGPTCCERRLFTARGCEQAVIKANHTHTVDQLKRHVASLAPGTADTLSRGGFRAVSFSTLLFTLLAAGVAFSLKGGFPPQCRSRRGRLVARPFSYTPLMSSRSGSLIRREASRSPTRSCSTRCSSSAPSDELDAAVGQAVLPRRHPTQSQSSLLRRFSKL